MANVILFLIIVLLTTVIVLLGQYTTRYIYKYKIRETCIEITLFGIPLKRIYFNNIAEIRKTRFRETLPFRNADMFKAVTFENRLWGELVLIRQEKGFFGVILLSPDNADKFIQEVQHYISINKTI